MEIKMPVIPFRSRWPHLLFAGLLFLVLLASLLGLLVYQFPDSLFGQALARRFPFPIVFIGAEAVVTSEGLAENRAALRHFYEHQDFSALGMRVDFTTDEGKKRLKLREKDLLNKMLEDEAVKLLAGSRGITINDEQVAAETTVKMKELGTTDKVEETLARLYDWSIADFQDKIVRPALYEEALHAEFEKEVNHEAALERIHKAEALLKEKQPFAEVARSLSEGQTREAGGDLGWFGLEDLAPELRGPVDTAKLNIPSQVIESELGYHIVLVEETKLEEGKRLYRLRQIFTRKMHFSDWLLAEIERLPVSVFSREYTWEKDAGRIEFRDESMRVFEKEAREKAESDPTLVF